MGYRFIELSDPIDNVARLTLRREQKRNAMCMEMRDEIENALNRVVADAGVRALVLAGGQGVFSAGFDLKEGMETGGKSFLHRFREFFEACYLFPKPVVAAVDGLALAGGFDLALMADFVVASSRSQFGHPEIDFGPVAVLPLSRFVSGARLRQLCMLGERFDAETAKDYGIVQEIVGPGAAVAAAAALATRLAAKPPAGMAGVKRALARGIQEVINSDADALEAIVNPDGDDYKGYVGRKLGGN